jgi:hypothetical protein
MPPTAIRWKCREETKYRGRAKGTSNIRCDWREIPRPSTLLTALWMLDFSECSIG